MAVHTPHQRLRSSAFWGSGGENNLGEKTVKRDIKHQTIQKCHCSPETNVQISLETCVCECCLMQVCVTWERSGETSVATSHSVSSHFYWWSYLLIWKEKMGFSVNEVCDSNVGCVGWTGRSESTASVGDTWAASGSYPEQRQHMVLNHLAALLPSLPLLLWVLFR